MCSFTQWQTGDRFGLTGNAKKRGACEQWIKEGKGAVKWKRLSRRSFATNAVRLQFHALAYNLADPRQVQFLSWNHSKKSANLGPVETVPKTERAMGDAI